MLGDLTPPQLRPHFPLRQRRWQISNICILRSKNTSAASWCFLSVQQQMSRHDGTAPGSNARAEQSLPAWNVDTYRGNYWSETCWTNTITLIDGKGKDFVKWWPLEVGQVKERWVPRTWAPNFFCLQAKVSFPGWEWFPAFQQKEKSNNQMWGGPFIFLRLYGPAPSGSHYAVVGLRGCRASYGLIMF